MKKNVLLAGALAATLALPLAACGSQPAATTGDGGSGDAPAAEQGGDFDAHATYWGQWRGSVEITGTTVYGTAGGSEQMLDLQLNEDGTCEVTPLEAHADLPTDSGTWDGTESEITLHLDTAGDVTLTVVDDVTCEGDAHAFGIADFDTINFDFYG
ncbi:hypothetical protein [Olsenella profusa]|uniref:Lipoprotein n=1 Tax=Olsenella profusa TaxID=138595 RepID=A0ABS2F1U3_9ACTN|nr:hypothetical protein [Olsenella profusa]MBM6774563.1 hypothetical protein [Olsenella profusa]